MRKQLQHRKYLATRWNLFVELDICTSELQWLNLIGHVYSTNLFWGINYCIAGTMCFKLLLLLLRD